MLIYKRNVNKKNKTLSQLGAEKIAFPSKSDGRTDGRTEGRTYGQTYGQKDGHMDRRTDISNYRVASLIIIKENIIRAKIRFIVSLQI